MPMSTIQKTRKGQTPKTASKLAQEGKVARRTARKQRRDVWALSDSPSFDAGTVEVANTYLDRTEVDSILASLAGKMVTVNCVKDNGQARTLNGKLVPSPATHSGRSTLFTIQLAKDKDGAKQYRSADRGQIQRIAGNGKVYMVRGSLAHFM